MAEIVRRSEAEPSLARWDPFQLMKDLTAWDPYERLERAFAPLAVPRPYVPLFDVRETAGEYVFKADLPGLKEENLYISLTGHRLTIGGKREEEERKEGETYYAVERSHGQFSRTFTLPDGCDLDHIDADLKDGVLTVTVPKHEGIKPRRISLRGIKEKIAEKLKA